MSPTDFERQISIRVYKALEGLLRQTAKNMTNYRENDKNITDYQHFFFLSKLFCLICFQHRKGQLSFFCSAGLA